MESLGTLHTNIPYSSLIGQDNIINFQSTTDELANLNRVSEI